MSEEACIMTWRSLPSNATLKAT